MFLVSVEHIRSGMTVAHNIFSAAGALLLSSGSVLTRTHINRLKALGIPAVYIKNPYYECEEPPPVIRTETKLRVLALTREALLQAQTKQTVNYAAFRGAVQDIVDEMVINRHLLVHLTDIRAHDDYTFAHSLNVCLLSAMTGIKLGYSVGKLRELAVGGLFHDLGKMFVPVANLNKPGPLDAEEWVIMKQHSEIGFEVLRQQREDIPLLSAHIALQHHENYDGTGYPQQLAGEEILEYARIAAVADAYDALISDRPYRPALLPHKACEIIMDSRGSRFDPEIADAFLENIAVYPIGTMVKLNTGEIGTVVKVFEKLQARPVIRLLTDAGGRLHRNTEAMADLSEEPTRHIVKVLKPEEFLALDEGGHWQALAEAD